MFESRNIMLEGVLTHTNFFDEETAKQRFCKTIIFGAENFNDNILKSIRKSQSVQMILEKAQLAKAAGLNTRLEYIVGLPGENSSSIIKSKLCV